MKGRGLLKELSRAEEMVQHPRSGSQPPVTSVPVVLKPSDFSKRNFIYVKLCV